MPQGLISKTGHRGHTHAAKMSATPRRSPLARLAALAGVPLAGAVTSGVALAVVFLSSEHGTNLMLWHTAYVIPIGPILIGLVASSGVLAGARLIGVRPRGLTSVAIGGFLVATYFIAEYVGFHVRYPDGVVDEHGTLLGFWSYLDWFARHLTTGTADIV